MAGRRNNAKRWNRKDNAKCSSRFSFAAGHSEVRGVVSPSKSGPVIAEQSLERLALAQHYGLATRLLDWTRNPLVALFFAIVDGVEQGLYGGVYALIAPE